METKLSKREIEKLIKGMLPHVTIERWEENELILDIDITKLKAETVRKSEVYIYRKPVKNRKKDYVICPVIKGDETKYFIVIQ